MKTRNGFVSNSSSSSFVVSLDKITARQYVRIAKKIKELNCDEYWTMENDEDEIHLSTPMDNFNMYAFLIKIGVKEENIV